MRPGCLAEQGHDVIRVESPAGDAVRRQGPFLGGVPDIEDGAYHQFFNAGKRSVALDVTTAAGREAFARLARTADTIVASTPLPLPEAELRALNPDVVLVLVTDDDLPELCAYARSGLLSITGHPDRAPVLMGGHIMYAATGLWVMVAAASALLVQRMTGEGQTVTVDIQQCFESFLDHAHRELHGARTARRAQRRARFGDGARRRAAEQRRLLDAEPDGLARAVADAARVDAGSRARQRCRRWRSTKRGSRGATSCSTASAPGRARSTKLDIVDARRRAPHPGGADRDLARSGRRRAADRSAAFWSRSIIRRTATCCFRAARWPRSGIAR